MFLARSRQKVAATLGQVCKQYPRLAQSLAEEIALSEFGSAARWTPGTTEAWLDYTEDGPWEIARFLQKRLARRARESRESAAAAAGGMPSAPAGTPVAALRMQRSFTPSAGSDLPTPASTATLTPEPMD